MFASLLVTLVLLSFILFLLPLFALNFAIRISACDISNSDTSTFAAFFLRFLEQYGTLGECVCVTGPQIPSTVLVLLRRRT